MAAIKFYIPTSEVANFKKFMAKAMKRVNGISYSLSEPFNRVFRHHDASTKACIKKMHTIVDVTVDIESDSQWKLLAFYKDGFEFIVERSSLLILKNPEHGKDYHHCDACGHWLKNSYLILNAETGEELQVGSECLKTYGIETFKKLHQFTIDLYRIYNADMDYDSESWGSPYKDLSAKQSVESTDLIKAAKLYYDTNKNWKPKSALRQGSSDYIANILFDKESKLNSVSDEYVNAVRLFGSNIQADTDFKGDMLSVATDYYTTAQYAAAAFFLIKNYEFHLSQSNLPKIEEGMQVHVAGKMIAHNLVEGYYGFYESNEMLTNKGYTVIRYGKIEFDEETKEVRPFFAIVKSVSDRGIILDRACKHPKKGIAIVEL